MSATTDVQVVGPQEEGERFNVRKWLERARLNLQTTREQAIVSEDTSPAFQEAFRLLAQSIELMVDRRHLKSILVMSAYPGEGRTTVVVNLGILLARLGKRVVLVDADSRHPSDFSLLGSSASGSPSDNGSLPRSDTEPPVRHRPGLRGTDVERLRIFSPGSHHSEIFGRRGIGHLLHALASECDLVLIDSSSCLQHSEAFEIAPLADGIVYVVQRRSQDGGAQRRVLSHLETLGGKLLGVVYNEG